MALTYTALGQVDPSRVVLDQSSAPTDLTMRAIQFSFLTTDYSSGLAITPSSAGFTAILNVFGATLRSSAGTHKKVLPIFDVANTKLRFMNAAGATATTTYTEITNADMADSDIVSCVVVGF